ncbi:MAG: DUF3822 family protein [Bacteroidota bacterium]
MAPLFNIPSSTTNFSTARLFVEIGECCLSYFILDHSDKISSICVYQFTDKLQTESEVRNILYNDPLFKEKFEKIDIIYSFADSVLVPREIINNVANKDLLELVYGDFADKLIRNDQVVPLNIQNVYRIPTAVGNVVNNLFPAAHVHHLYSLLPVMLNLTGNRLSAIFSTTHIIVVLSKDGHLQVMQNFTYQTPEDAAYHLLNTCQSFDVDVNEVNLLLSGMIAESSPLYAELYKYFLNIDLALLPVQYEYSDEIKKYPQHFFSHLFTIAECV